MHELTPTLYLPVEDASREMDAKILVGAAAVSRGFSVVIGQQWLLGNNHEAMPRGIMFFKGMNARQYNAMKHIAASGHLIAANDEEAMGLADEAIIARDIDPCVGDVCSLFLAQGAVHEAAIRTHVGARDTRIRRVGNPRIDLLRTPFRALYEGAAATLRARHGDYVLVNTNHGSINSAFGDLNAYRDVVIRIGWMDPDKPEDVDLFDRHVARDRANIDVIRRAVLALAEAEPDLTIVLRPHGSERRDTWENFFAKAANVRIIREGSHVAWVLGAKLLLHTGCTTGMEAEIMDAPAISILPEQRDGLQHEFFVSNAINRVAEGAMHATDLARRHLAGDANAIGADSSQRREILGRHFSGLSGAFSFQRTADALEALYDASASRHARMPWEPVDRSAFMTDIRRTGYQRDKISIDKTAFTNKWHGLSKLGGLDAPVRIREIGDSLFVVEGR